MGWRKFTLITVAGRLPVLLLYSLGSIGLDAIFPFL